MNNPLLVMFSDKKEVIYHIAIGFPIREAITEIEQETGKQVIKFKWLMDTGQDHWIENKR